MVYKYVISALIGYLFGLFNPAYFIAKKRGFDIRTRGSKNPGASNAFITMGPKIGALVGLFDILKAAAAVFAVMLLFPRQTNLNVIAGVACVFGHMFPVTMRFRGGKGFASFLGMTLILSWKYFAVIIVAVALITLITDYIVIGTMTTVISYPIFSYLTHSSIAAIIIVSCASLIIIFKHRGNLVRIAKGEEIGFRKNKGKSG